MNLFFNKFLSNLPIAPPQFRSKNDGQYSTAAHGLSCDAFTKSIPAKDISFTGKRSSGSTKKGDVLKDLDNITCPYSGIKMITPKNMDRIEARLAKCNNISERMEVLEPYRPCMQKLEKQIYTVLKGYEINNPKGSMNDCLQQIKPECLAELRIAQFKVLDDVDKSSNKLDAKTALKVREITTNARRKIIEDRQDQIFKRKDLLKELYNVTEDCPEKEVVAEMWAKANKLPKSTNNFDAFVVKYANRSSQEISARLLRPSVVSIEHIRPANPESMEVESGEDNLANFMMAARDWNSGRSNTPLPQFIKQHPNIPKYTQKYIDDIIKAIHKGKLKDCDWYPYVIKERLLNESEGLINLNLDKYKIPKEEAFENIPDDILNSYNKLVEENSTRYSVTLNTN